MTYTPCVLAFAIMLAFPVTQKLSQLICYRSRLDYMDNISHCRSIFRHPLFPTDKTGALPIASGNIMLAVVYRPPTTVLLSSPPRPNFLACQKCDAWQEMALYYIPSHFISLRWTSFMFSPQNFSRLSFIWTTTKHPWRTLPSYVWPEGSAAQPRTVRPRHNIRFSPLDPLSTNLTRSGSSTLLSSIFFTSLY